MHSFVPSLTWWPVWRCLVRTGHWTPQRSPWTDRPKRLWSATAPAMCHVCCWWCWPPFHLAAGAASRRHHPFQSQMYHSPLRSCLSPTQLPPPVAHCLPTTSNTFRRRRLHSLMRSFSASDWRSSGRPARMRRQSSLCLVETSCSNHIFI